MLPDKRVRAKHYYRDEHHILGSLRQWNAFDRVEMPRYRLNFR